MFVKKDTQIKEVNENKKKSWSSVFSSWKDIESTEIPKIVYDDIVDDSDFKPTAEKIRDQKFSSNGSAAELDSLPYDYPENQVIKEKVDDITLALRNNRLDKADVQKLNEALTLTIDKQFKESKASSELKAAERASKNRTAALDAALGVNQEDK